MLAAVPCAAIGFHTGVQLAVTTAASGVIANAEVQGTPGQAIVARISGGSIRNPMIQYTNAPYPWHEPSDTTERSGPKYEDAVRSQYQSMDFVLGTQRFGSIRTPNSTFEKAVPQSVSGGPYAMYASLPGLSRSIGSRIYATTEEGDMQLVSFPS